LQVVFSVFAIMQDPQRTLVDWLECLLANSANASSLRIALSRPRRFLEFHPPPRFVLATPLPRPGDSREGLLSALKGVIRKKAKQGGPFSFEIENTETRRPRNQVDPGILQQGFPLNSQGYSLERTGTMAKVAEKRKS